MGIRTYQYIEYHNSNNSNNNVGFAHSHTTLHDHFNYIHRLNHHRFHQHRDQVKDIYLHKQQQDDDDDEDEFYKHFNTTLPIFNLSMDYMSHDHPFLSSLNNTSIYHSLQDDANDEQNITFGCRYCRTHLSTTSNIISRDYRGITGTAYLMSNVINIIEGQMESRLMITGQYLVCDIKCQLCKHLLGWKYIKAERLDQKFKEGMFILELKPITLVN